jgi:hypothetical protein
VAQALEVDGVFIWQAALAAGAASTRYNDFELSLSTLGWGLNEDFGTSISSSKMP